MLNYRRLCRYSESEKRLVISALEVKHFSNGTSDVERGLRLFRWKERQRNMKVQYLASSLRWGSGYLGLSPDFTLGMPAQPEALCTTSHMWSIEPSSKVIAPFVPTSPISQRRSWHSKILSSMDGGIWTQSLWSQEPMTAMMPPSSTALCWNPLCLLSASMFFCFRRQNLNSNELNDSGIGSVPWEEREISWGTEGGGLRHNMTWGFCLASASSYDGFFLSSWTASSFLLSFLPLAGVMRTMSPQTFVLLPPTSECFSSVSCSLKNPREETLLAWHGLELPSRWAISVWGVGSQSTDTAMEARRWGPWTDIYSSPCLQNLPWASPPLQTGLNHRW